MAERSHQPVQRASGGPATMSSAGPAVARGVAATWELLVRSLHRLHIGCERTGALRSSVGSTEAANEVVARFGVIDV